jgi:hypothetical protein
MIAVAVVNRDSKSAMANGVPAMCLEQSAIAVRQVRNENLQLCQRYIANQ